MSVLPKTDCQRTGDGGHCVADRPRSRLVAGWGVPSYDIRQENGCGLYLHPASKMTAERTSNGRNGGTGQHEHDVNPSHIVSVQDFSPETLRSVIAHLEVSTDFDHLIYREAELDAIWTITGYFLTNEPHSNERDSVKRLHAGVHQAHDFVAASRPDAAAEVLRGFL